MAKLKKIISAVVTALLLVTLVLALLLMLASVFLNMSGGRKTVLGIGLYQIVSGSMEPEIKVGDVVVAKSAGIKELKVGDNAVFVYGDKLVTHKVIEIGSDYVITKGNANSSTERVAAADIVARQLFILPKLGYLVDFLRSGFGFALVIALPLGGLIVWQTVTLTRRLKEYRAERESEPNADGAEAMKAEIERLKSRLRAGVSAETKEQADGRESADKRQGQTNKTRPDKDGQPSAQDEQTLAAEQASAEGEDGNKEGPSNDEADGEIERENTEDYEPGFGGKLKEKTGSKTEEKPLPKDGQEDGQ